jgi:hypothetical protein
VLFRYRKPTGLFARTVTPVLLGIVFLGFLGGVLWGVAWWSSRNNATVRMSNPIFDSLSYEKEAKRIAKEGPQLYPGRGYIYVQHLGDDATKGWYAFNAIPAGQSPKCTVLWKQQEQHFVNPCDGQVFPATGEGLRQFDAIPQFETKKLVIDLRAER